MDRKLFFEEMRAGLLGPTLDDTEVSGCNAILDAVGGLATAWAAYAFATAYHETAHTMQPIREYGSARRSFRLYDRGGARPNLAIKMGNIYPGDGVKFDGRGYVQLTWRSNYAKAAAKLGHDLLNNPDLAMRPDIAAMILREGMVDGWFTGKRFSSYLSARATREQFVKARYIINGTDKAGLIAGYALKFQNALVKAGWQ